MGREYATSYCSQIRDMVQRDSARMLTIEERENCIKT